MLELVFFTVLSVVFYIGSKKEKRFEKKRDQYIDKNKVFLNKTESSDNIQ